MANELKTKNYWDMTATEKLAETNAFFRDLQARYDEFEVTGKAIYNQIDEILCEKRPFEELTKLIRSEECRHACVVENSFVNLRFWYGVCEKEYASGKALILYYTNSVEEADMVLQKLHFYLRRIEFEWENEVCEDIVKFVIDHHLSYILLAETICKTKYKRPIYVSMQLAEMLEHAGMRLEAMKLLCLVEAYMKGEKEYYDIE